MNTEIIFLNFSSLGYLTQRSAQFVPYQELMIDPKVLQFIAKG